MLRRLIYWPRLQLRARPATRYFIPATRQSSSQASPTDRITSKLPQRLRKYTDGLRNAPASHVVGFLILHEITAVASLLVLFALFHYTTYMPTSYMTEHFEEYIQAGIAKFESYFRRKGWFGFGQEESIAEPKQSVESQDESRTKHVMGRLSSGERKYEILVEVALAYAATKALLPIRIIGSIWATPWFAGVLMRIKHLSTRGQ